MSRCSAALSAAVPPFKPIGGKEEAAADSHRERQAPRVPVKISRLYAESVCRFLDTEISVAVSRAALVRLCRRACHEPRQKQGLKRRELPEYGGHGCGGDIGRSLRCVEHRPDEFARLSRHVRIPT